MILAVIALAYAVVAHADYCDSRRLRIARWQAAPLAAIWPASVVHVAYRKYCRTMRK